MLLAANGRPLLVSAGRPLLEIATGDDTSMGSSGFAGPTPGAVAGLSGWWDAGSLAGLLDSSRHAPTAWGLPVQSIEDKSGNGAVMTAYHWYAGGAPAALVATPRLNGFLGGLGAPVAQAAYAPTLDPDTGLGLAAL